MSNERRLVWDLPTRLFHWAFAGSVLAAFGTAQVFDDESKLFSLHFLFGAVAGVLLLVRLVWGFIGSKHARFASMIFSPQETVAYFRAVLSGKGRYYAGHNPGGALAIWGMLVLTAVTVVSGIGMGTYGKAFEEIHEAAAIGVILIAAAHVLGVMLASKMHGESYAKAMVTGYKPAGADEAIGGTHPLGAAALVAVLVASTSYFVAGYDVQAAVFQAPGTSFALKLGEDEDEERERGGHGGGVGEREGGGDGDRDGDGDGDGNREGHEEAEEDEDGGIPTTEAVLVDWPDALPLSSVR